MTGAVLALLVSACGQAAPSTGGGAVPEGGTIKIRINSAWDPLDPVANVSIPGGAMIGAAYDKLVAVDSDNKIVPYVAKSWESTATKITFTLRDDVKCADGSPMNATNVYNSLKYTFDPKVQSIMRPRQFGPGPYEVTKDDARNTVTVTLGTPYSDAVYGFASGQGSLICPEGLKDPKAMANQSFGTGPFFYKPEDVRQGEQVTVHQNPSWTWGPFGVNAKTPGVPKEIVFQVVASDTTAANLLVTGGLDIASVSGADVPRLIDDKSLTTFKSYSAIGWSLQLNQRAGSGRPMTDPVLRQAVSMIVNRDDFAKAAWTGLGVTATSMVTKGGECYDPETEKLLPPYGIDKAKALLQGAGYKIGANGKIAKPDGSPLNLVLNGVNGYNHGNGEDYIVAQLQSLGIDTRMNKTDLQTWLTDQRAGNFDISVTHTGGGTPSQMVANFFGPPPPAGSNYTGISNPVLDKEVPLANASVGAEKCQHWVLVQRALAQGYHFFPLGTPNFYVFSRNLTWRAAFGASTPDYGSIVRVK